jgi:transposase InsO family protein
VLRQHLSGLIEDASNDIAGVARLVLQRAQEHWNEIEADTEWKDQSRQRHKTWLFLAAVREAMEAVRDWRAFYHCRRLHSTLGHLSPSQYEQRWYEKQRGKSA